MYTKCDGNDGGFRHGAILSVLPTFTEAGKRVEWAACMVVNLLFKIGRALNMNGGSHGSNLFWRRCGEGPSLGELKLKMYQTISLLREAFCFVLFCLSR